MNETHIDGATSAGDAASFAAPSEITSVSFTASATHSGGGGGGADCCRGTPSAARRG
eukprot:CAMPEP_0113679386 /NCGR_PEP_ID=MMETSP0038_2-20120614/10605_1 /TAXON_ID=2898 /ORGANISM="Cryptomonas paramecium" /LENGTH=56 /DNA_ID=CAMNT_0000597391 /DNA_START=974 /DNA_END=1144 /DNA_ORIENTATION=+ /assembly_acc=CAM_ASM_000170